MQILDNKDCKYYKKNNACELYEYSAMGSEFDMAIAKISGKYPDRGYCINMICKEIIYIIEGEGIIYEGEKEHKIKKGDVIIIKNGERFKWDANCIASISCIPAWNPDKYDMLMD